MSRPATGRRIDVRRSQIYGGSGPVAPYASDLIHAWYADREIVLATGVAAWGDAVGTTDFAQADTSKQPAYGLFTASPALVFDDVNDSMQGPSMDLTPYTELTVCMNVAFVGSGAGMIFSSAPNVAVANGAWYFYESAGTVSFVRHNSASNPSRAIAIVAGPATVIGVFSTTDPSSIPRAYVNGVLGGAAPAAANTPHANTVPWIGAESAGNPWGGKVGDVLIYGRALTAGEVATVNAWLTARRV